MCVRQYLCIIIQNMLFWRIIKYEMYGFVFFLTELPNDSTVNTTTDLISKSQISVVRYAYVTIGSIVFVASALYAAAYCQDRFTKHSPSTIHQQIPMSHQTTDKDGTEVSVRKPAEQQFRHK